MWWLALGGGSSSARRLRSRLCLTSAVPVWLCGGWALWLSNEHPTPSKQLLLLLSPSLTHRRFPQLTSHIHPRTSHRAPLRSGCLQYLPGRRARGPLRRCCPPPRGRNEVRRSWSCVFVLVHAGAGNSLSHARSTGPLACDGVCGTLCWARVCVSAQFCWFWGKKWNHDSGPLRIFWLAG